jgi:glycosyltransferase involved in cell wall biosynthesis
MRLLNVVRSLNPLGGGVAEGLLRSSHHLSTLGVHSTFLSLDPPESPWLSSYSNAFGLGPTLGRYGYLKGLPHVIRAFAKNSDSVIVHGLWQYHSLATWRALHAINIPYYVFTHGMLDPWFKQTYPIKHLKKWAYWPWADYRVLRDAKAVLFTTEQERLLARKSFWLYQANERVVGYGTSMPPGNSSHQCELFLSHFPHLRGQRVLLFLSRIHPKKGLDHLIEAFAAVAPSCQLLQLVIAGPDQIGWQTQLENRAMSLGIAHRITWAGMLSGDVKWGAFRAAELFCLPSHQENFGIVVAEALACGLPVAIAKPVNISSEVLSAGAGLVHDDTIAGTTEALFQWLALTPAERLLMGQKGAHLFRDVYDCSSHARNLFSVLTHLR